MKSYSEICSYLVNKPIIDDKVYSVLVDSEVGIDIQKSINEIIYNSAKKNFDDGNYEMIIERILLPRISIIKKEIEKLILECGYDVSKVNLLGDKLECIDRKAIEHNKRNKIDTLYQEFIIIRNGVWNYHLYLLNDILKKYDDDPKYDDIYQEAGIALMTAIEKFDYGKYNFKAFAGNYIRYSINYHYHDLDFYLKVPINKLHLYYKMLKTIEGYVNKYHKMPTRDDLLNELNITKRILSTFLSLSLLDFISLGDTSYQEYAYMKNEEIIGSDDIRQVEDKVIGETLENLLATLFQELTDRERVVIDDYYLKNNGIDFWEISKKLGVSYGTTMNLRKRAFTKLRKHEDELGKYLR